MKLADARHSALYQSRTIAMQSDDTIDAALRADRAAAKIMAKDLQVHPGELVGVRLNLNVFKSRGVLVQTIHAGNRSDGYRNNRGFFNGSVLAYRKHVTLRGAFFNVSQSGRHKIASGLDSKHPMASVDGVLHEAEHPEFSGIEISFNPHRVHLFTDRDFRPIRYAEEATIYGHRIYVRGEIEYYTEGTAPQKIGDADSAVQFQPASGAVTSIAAGQQAAFDLASLLD